jgi:cobalt-zinc-cadmium efflux system membrane fusion protein
MKHSLASFSIGLLNSTSLLILSILLCISLMMASQTANAHGDDDHGAAAPVMNQVVAPRAIATSEDFELVAILNKSQLIIYLDQFVTNTPILNAHIEVEGAGLKQIAKETSLGVYEITLPKNFPNKYALTFTVETEETVDLLNAVLDSTPPVDVHDHDETSYKQWYFMIVGLLVLLGGADYIRRQLNRKKP